MEVKAFTDSLFLPLMVQREFFDDNLMVAYDSDCIMNMDTWVEDMSGLCYIPDLIKIELTFDGDINSPKFDPSKAEIFSIIATKPKSFVNDDDPMMTEDENSNMLKNIMNCFSGSMFNIPKEMHIFNNLIEDHWSYRVCLDVKIFVCVVNGSLAFECL